VLLVAGLGFAGLDLVVAARVLGFLSVTVTLGSLLFASMRPGRPGADWFPPTAGLLFVSLSAPVAVWMIGGLEQPLIGALLAVSIPLMYSALRTEPPQRAGLFGLSGVLGLLAITRPDGPLFAASAAGTFLLAGPGRYASRLIGVFKILAFPVLCYGGQALFRYFYYGEVIPNTALVKLTPTAVRRADGVDYLSAGLETLSPFSYLAIAAMVGLLAVPGRRGRALYLLSVSSLWSAYVVVIGGDIFPAYRHLVPLIVVFAFALVELFDALSQVLDTRRWVMTAVAVLTLAAFVPFAQGQPAAKHNHRAVTERWEWQCRDLGVILKKAFSAAEPLVAVTAAGCLPYWSELPSLDMLGLNDYYLPRHPPPDLGTGFLGHELGDGAYVLGRKPDLIVFSVGSEPGFRSGIQMAGMPEFHERYIPVRVHVEGMSPEPLVYFDRGSAKIGIIRSESFISVPGFLFGSDGPSAYLNKMGKLVVPVTKGQPAQVTFPAEPHAAWRVELISPRPELVTARLARGAGVVTVTLSTEHPEPVDVEAVVLRADGTPPGR